MIKKRKINRLALYNVGTLKGDKYTLVWSRGFRMPTYIQTESKKTGKPYLKRVKSQSINYRKNGW